MDLRVFALLHIAQAERSAVNVRVRDFNEQLGLYAGNALALAASLNTAGLRLTVLTNEPELLERTITARRPMPSWLSLSAIPFPTEVPQGIGFYSAHSKFDAFRWLATRPGDDYRVLCDIDVVATKDSVPGPLAHFSAARTPLCYEITDQMAPAVGTEQLRNMITSVTRQPSEGRWYGGEFLAGSRDFFEQLVERVDKHLPRYWEVWRELPTTGDEVVTSAALEELMRDGLSIEDAGRSQLVGRFWARPVRHAQRPLEHFRECFLLHLPASKPELAEYGWSAGPHDPPPPAALIKQRPRGITLVRRLRARLRAMGS